MWRKDFFLHRTSRKLCIFLLMLQFALVHSVSYFFFPYWSSSLFLRMVFNAISSNIDEVPSVNWSDNVFVFEDFNVYHKDWLTYSGRNDRPGDLFHNFSISNDLTHMINFITQIPDCDSHKPNFLDLFFLTLICVWKWFSLHWEFCLCDCLSFHWLFFKLNRWYPNSSHSLWLSLRWLRWSLWSFERYSIWWYLSTQCFWSFSWILWVISSSNWCIYLSFKYCLRPHLSNGFSFLFCCPHNTLKELFLFAPTK